MPSSPLPRHLWPRTMYDPEPMPRSFEARADAIHRGNTPPVMRGWSRGATGTPRVELPMPDALNPRLVVPLAKAGGEGCAMGKAIEQTAVRAAGRAFGAMTSFGMGKGDDEDFDDAGDKALAEDVESAVLRHLLANEQHENMAKAEGERGGKIIGHTKSGKPIYAGHDEHNGLAAHHSAHAHFTAEDHDDAAKAHEKRRGVFNATQAQSHRIEADVKRGKDPWRIGGSGRQLGWR